MKKENQRIMLTKRLLRETLIKMLREMPIDKVSITKLCHASGINRSTFYSHYNTPGDILFDIKRDFATQAVKSLKSLTPNATPKEQLVRICEYISANADLEKIILANSTDDEVTDAIIGRTFDMWYVAERLMKNKNIDKETHHLATVFFHHGLFRVIREWIMNDIQKSPYEIAEILNKLIFT